jgi:hypothetical protein
VSDDDIVVVAAQDTTTVVTTPAVDVVTLETASGTATITEIDHVVIQDPEPPTAVVEDDDPVVVVTLGTPGPRGRPGADGTGIEVAFAYGDASPAAVTLAEGGRIIYRVELHIAVPFDGAGAALAVGDASDPDRLMTVTENDPALIGSSQTYPAFIYGADTNVTLTITPGAGASQGAGFLKLYIQQ